MNINTNISQSYTKDSDTHNDTVFNLQSSVTTVDCMSPHTPNDIVQSPINFKRDMHENIHNIDINYNIEKTVPIKNNLTLDEKLSNFRKKNGIFEPSSY